MTTHYFFWLAPSSQVLHISNFIILKLGIHPNQSKLILSLNILHVGQILV